MSAINYLFYSSVTGTEIRGRERLMDYSLASLARAIVYQSVSSVTVHLKEDIRKYLPKQEHKSQEKPEDQCSALLVLAWVPVIESIQRFFERHYSKYQQLRAPKPLGRTNDVGNDAYSLRVQS